MEQKIRMPSLYDAASRTKREIREKDLAATAEAAASTLKTAEGWIDPYPSYATLRECAPVHYDRELDMYLLTRYSDCHEALASPHMRAPDHSWHDKIMPDWREHPAAMWCFTSLPFEPPANHGRIRRLVHRAFTPRRVVELIPSIRLIVSNLLDALFEKGKSGDVVDLQDTVGFRLPVAVIAALVGVPDKDLPRFRWVFGQILRIMDIIVDEHTVARADIAMIEVQDYFAKLLRWRRDHPADDLITALVRANDADGDRLSSDELLSLVILLFTAGFETTTLTIGTGTHAILTHRDQFESIKNDPSLAAGAADEALRWDCALHRVVRVADQDMVFDQRTIPAGSIVAPLIGAGNRDPHVFTDPDRFDLRRSGPRPLTFGGGPYVCLGYALAKLELEIYFASLATRFPGMELAGEPVRRRASYVRGFDTLPVTLSGR